MRKINAFLGKNKLMALAIGLGLFVIGLAMFMLLDSPVQYVGLILVAIGVIIVPTLKELRGDRQEEEEEYYQ